MFVGVCVLVLVLVGVCVGVLVCVVVDVCVGVLCACSCFETVLLFE